MRYATSELDILRRLQRLLEEGGFVATYKFALLQALADICVERQPSRDGSLWIPLDAIAEKFIEYYWRQVVPFGESGTATVLKQSTGRQAAVVKDVAALHSSCAGNLVSAKRRASDWRQLVRHVATTVEKMPLWKLQTVGRSADEFVYRKDEYADRRIRLLPGVASTFRTFHGLITHLVRGAWSNQVRQISGNRALLGTSADLHEFLFGSDRVNLDAFRSILRDVQRARCFYCGTEVRSGEAADHFIPWSRYSIDLGHNFVFAHASCNSSKSDYLAHPDHLSKWREQNLDGRDVLAEAFDAGGLAHDAERSADITSWAYEQGEGAGAYAWYRKGELTKLDSSWRAAMSPVLAVAETSPIYGFDDD